ncbi:RNA-directed DNA polymerase, eukaryota, reverse transcriptase zinc-binding domain protein [Tanacetum coccineum]
MNKIERVKLLVWVKRVNIPMKAWSVEGIITLASDAKKQLKNEVKIQYSILIRSRMLENSMQGPKLRKKKRQGELMRKMNKEMEGRVLWKDLNTTKSITTNYPWMLMGDFNVTLKVIEHSASVFEVSNDMHDFIDCVNRIEGEDMYSNGLLSTWIKSPSRPYTSILKKLDSAMANEEFILKYPLVGGNFLPYLVSDQSCVVIRKNFCQM